MQNIEIAWALEELADLLEFKGDDYFKIRAYRRAARTLAGLKGHVEEMYRQGTLKQVPGIGKNILAKVGELIEYGRLEKLEELRLEIPRGVREIMLLPGLGPAKASFLHHSLGVGSLAELQGAARERRIRGLKGMGAKTELGILRSIELLQNRQGFFLLSLARRMAVEMTAFLGMLPGVERVEPVGAVRRWRETVECLELLAACVDPEPLLEAMASFPRAAEVLERGPEYIKIITTWGLPVTLTTVEPTVFFNALVKGTGSGAHLEELSRHCGEGALNFQGEVFASEEDFYQHLGMPLIPPELREGTGEVAAALGGKLPDLVGPEDIKGDLHLHSGWSDGSSSIPEIMERAKALGYSYVAVTDHSRSLKIARGLSTERLLEQYDYIDGLNLELHSRGDNFRVLKGVEVDILSQGGLDFPDEVLERADVVVASIHSGFKQEMPAIMSRLEMTLKSPHVDIMGHLTGRVLGQRPGYALDVDRVLELAAENKKILEINSSPDRLDLNDKNARSARELGVKLAINTDAHDIGAMEDIRYGVSVARRAWLEPGDVVNTMELEDLIKLLN